VFAVVASASIAPAPSKAATRPSATKPAKPAVKSPAKSLEIPRHCPAQVSTAIVPDGYGRVWVSGEDTGSYHAKLTVQAAPRKNQLSHHHAQPGEPAGLSHRYATTLIVQVR
jgi:hypothetical protein